MRSMLKGAGAWLCAIALVASCKPAGLQELTPSVSQGSGASVPLAAESIRGQVFFPVQRRAQATLQQIAVGATVSLINTGTNQTVSTALTDGNGNFVLSFPGGFHPDPNLTYYMEAYKGLNGNLPSSNAVRVRTLVRFTGGWVSISSATPGSGITLNSATTALSIGAALINNNPTPFDFTSLMGAINVPAGDTYTPVTGLSQLDFTSLLSLVTGALTANTDPVATIARSGSNWVSITPGGAISVTGINPASGSVGTPVIISGNGFSTTLANDVFKFNNAAASLTSGTTTQLNASVPNYATSGQTTLQVGQTIVLGPLFTVPPVISGLSVASGSAGTSVTITGSGFDGVTQTGNQVLFGGVPGTVTSATPQVLKVTVPTGATSGPIALTVSGVTTYSSSSFTVPVIISSVSPTQTVPGVPISISGSGFSATPASNSVTLAGVAATVVSASPNTLVVTAPVVPSPGPAVVKVAGQSATSTDVYRNLVVLPVQGNLGGASAQRIDTLAGDIVPVVNQPSTTWPLYQPRGACVDASGTLYVATQEYAANGGTNVYTIGRIANGVYSRLAGGNPAGYSGDGGSALQARFNSPNGLAVDSAGNLYVADTSNHVIRKISAAGTVSTVAGNGTAGYTGDGVLATNAELNAPQGVAVDASGNLYIADTNNYRIRKINTSGLISTIAGTGTSGYTGDGGAATSAQISNPWGVVLDSLGNVYFSDNNNARIRKVDTNGAITTLVSSLSSVAGLSVDSANNLYAVDCNYWSSRLRKITTVGTPSVTVLSGTGSGGFAGDGGVAASAQLNCPQGVAVDGSGNVFIADTNNNRVRQINPGGIISSLTSGAAMYRGDNGPAAYAGLYLPSGVAVDSAGNTYVADTNNHVVRKVTPSGTITTLAGTGTAGFSGDAGAATSAQLNAPQGVAVDPRSGNLYIADTNNHRIRRVTPSGVISTVAGNGVNGFGGDGGAAGSGQLSYPQGVAVDPSTGNVYIADTNNHRIRQLQVASGVIVSVAGSSAGYGGDGALATSAQLYYPHGVAFQAPNIFYIADTNNNRVRKAFLGGTISTVAGTGTAGFSGDGGAATSAMVNSPWSVVVDASGNVYFSDQANNRVRMISPGGTITTFAGVGTPQYTGDGGLPVYAGLNAPRGIALDPSGGMRIADTSDGCLRWVH